MLVEKIYLSQQGQRSKLGVQHLLSPGFFEVDNIIVYKNELYATVSQSV